MRFFKRIMATVLAFVIGVITMPAIPFVFAYEMFTLFPEK